MQEPDAPRPALDPLSQAPALLFISLDSAAERKAALDRLAAQVGERYQVLRSRCEPDGHLCAYLPWRALLHQLLGLPVRSRDAWRRHGVQMAEVDIAERVLGRVPHRRRELPLLAMVLGSEIEENCTTRALLAAERRRLREAILLDLLIDAARQKPLLLLIEECQWLDPASITLLNALARTAHGDAPPAISLVLGVSPSARPQIAAQIPHHPDRRLLSADAPGAGSSGSRADLERMQRHLSEAESTALRVAALLGQQICGAELASAFPLGSAARVTEALERMCTLGLLRRSRAGGPWGGYCFAHSHFRELVSAGIPERLHCLLHERVAQHVIQGVLKSARDKTFEALSPALGATAGKIAHHYLQSHNRMGAATYVTMIAGWAKEEGELALAIRAMDLLLDHTPAGEQYAVRRELGQLLFTRGDWSTAKIHVERALVLAEQQKDQARLAECELDLALVQQRLNEPDTALSWRRSAERRCHHVTDVGQRTALLRRAACLFEPSLSEHFPTSLLPASVDL